MSISSNTTSRDTRNDDSTHEHVLRPRAVKPLNPAVLRTRESSDHLTPAHHTDGIVTESPASISGRSTPLSADAPPSVHVISSARKAKRASTRVDLSLRRARIFPTVEYSSRVSHFDAHSSHHDFTGFYVLFWVALTVMAGTTMLRNVKETGWPVRVAIWRLMTVKTWELAVADAAMVMTTGAGLVLHRLGRSEIGEKCGLRWGRGGMVVQSVYQAVWLCFWVAVPFYRQWTWTAQVALVLHTLVLLMKMHSYAFYNGHLLETERRLHALDHPSTASKAPAYQYPSTGEVESTEAAEAAAHAADQDEEESVSTLRSNLAFELTSPLGNTSYPSNLTWPNYVDFIFCPTLCYELEYPRTPAIDWYELVVRTLAVFGCIFLLTITSEEFMLPVLSESALRLEEVELVSEKGLILAETISMLLFPFMVTFLLVFLVIFEYVLGAFAEITCFADRHFYSDWWNSTDWLEFSREWNIPVHHFFRRHVYSASRPHLGRPLATLITFLISAVGHEIVMACITKKIRKYGFLAQMSQLPIVMLQRTKWVRERKTLNNVCFWSSMILGLSLICALYVLV